MAHWKDVINIQDASDLGEYKPLRCDLCHEVYKYPGDWVRHMERNHTEEQLRLSNITAKLPERHKIAKTNAE